MAPRIEDGKLELVAKDAFQLHRFNSLVDNSGCYIAETKWKSKYNSYVVYDYEPFCSDGFEIYLTITGEPNYLKFLKYLIEDRLKKEALLEACEAAIHYEGTIEKEHVPCKRKGKSYPNKLGKIQTDYYQDMQDKVSERFGI